MTPGFLDGSMIGCNVEVLFVLFFLQLQQPKAELEWTEEMKDRYRRKWRCRSILFWTLSSLHIAVCALQLGVLESFGEGRSLKTTRGRRETVPRSDKVEATLFKLCPHFAKRGWEE